MSEKKNSAIYPQKRTDTLIGPQVRIEGNIDFAGVLRVQGDILGNVACPADRRGTMIVDTAGSVIGAVQVSHIVVKGRVRGSTHSAQSLEIHAGAHCVGDTSYQTIDVHLGGVIEGLLTPAAGTAVDDAAPEASSLVVQSSAPGEPAPPSAEDSPRSSPPPGHRRRLAWGLVVAIAGLALVWVRRQPAETPPVVEPAPVEAAAPGAPVMSGTVAEGSGSNGGAVSPASVARAEAKAVAPAADPAGPDPEMKKVVTVQGVNPAKSADIVFLITNEASVLFKKKRDDSSAGKQIELGQGRNVSMAIARNELLRVAKGRELEMFYQGRKVPPANIESGVWMHFEPQLPGDAAAAADPR